MFTIEGSLKQLMPIQSGTAKASNQPWQKLDLVVTLQGDTSYPKELAVSIWNAELIEKVSRLRPGQPISLTCEVSSREYNGRYYTEVKAFRLENQTRQQPQQPKSNVPPQQQQGRQQQQRQGAPMQQQQQPHTEEALPF